MFGVSPGRSMRRNVLIGAMLEREQAGLRYTFLGAFRAPRLDGINAVADILACALRQLPRLGKCNGVEGTQAELAHPMIACGELKEPTFSLRRRDLEPEAAAIPVAPWLREFAHLLHVELVNATHDPT